MQAAARLGDAGAGGFGSAKVKAFPSRAGTRLTVLAKINSRDFNPAGRLLYQCFAALLVTLRMQITNLFCCSASHH